MTRPVRGVTSHLRPQTHGRIDLAVDPSLKLAEGCSGKGREEAEDKRAGHGQRGSGMGWVA